MIRSGASSKNQRDRSCFSSGDSAWVFFFYTEDIYSSHSQQAPSRYTICRPIGQAVWSRELIPCVFGRLLSPYPSRSGLLSRGGVSTGICDSVPGKLACGDVRLVDEEWDAFCLKQA